MATAVRQKGFLESKNYPLDMDELIATGAILSTVQMTASRTAPYPLQPTTLAAAVSIGVGTVSLNADPRAGALLIIEPGTGAEEKLKVISVAGSNPWVCTIKPTAWVTHNINAAVSYEPGMNARLFVDDTPTPAGTLVTPRIQKGAHLQKYRISYLGVCNNFEEVEDEFILEILDIVPTATPNIKQPSEIRDIAGDFTKKLEEPHQSGATLSSAVVYVSSSVNTATSTLAAQANAGVSTISLVAHPGIGAMLVLTPAGTGNNPPERVYVSNVTGGGPFTVTVIPDLEFQHVNGADVTIYQGYTGAFLTSPNSTFQGLFAVNRARGGQAGKTLKLVWVATTSQAEVLQVAGLCSIEEEA